MIEGYAIIIQGGGLDDIDIEQIGEMIKDRGKICDVEYHVISNGQIGQLHEEEQAGGTVQIKFEAKYIPVQEKK